MKRKLILASGSPYRRALLEKLGLPFDVVSPDVDETPLPGEKPQAMVERLALLKAQTVARTHPGTLVIGSDQAAVLDDKIIGKPNTHENAVAQLRASSGRRMVLYTALVLLDADSGRAQSEVVPFSVVFRKLTEEQIENYLRRERPYNCAGSVKSEGLGIVLLDKLEGDDPNTLIGLPLIRLTRMLEREDVRVL